MLFFNCKYHTLNDSLMSAFSFYTRALSSAAVLQFLMDLMRSRSLLGTSLLIVLIMLLIFFVAISSACILFLRFCLSFFISQCWFIAIIFKLTFSLSLSCLCILVLILLTILSLSLNLNCLFDRIQCVNLFVVRHLNLNKSKIRNLRKQAKN